VDITKKSLATGEWHTRDIAVTIEQYTDWLTGRDERLAQVIWTELPASDREFLITGITSEEWDELYGEDEEDIENDYAGCGDEWEPGWGTNHG
jgi:hypothetical protein